MNKGRVIVIVIGLLILVGAIFGLITLSNITGDTITGAAIGVAANVEKETFKINEDIGEGELGGWVDGKD